MYVDSAVIHLQLSDSAGQCAADSPVSRICYSISEVWKIEMMTEYQNYHHHRLPADHLKYVCTWLTITTLSHDIYDWLVFKWLRQYQCFAGFPNDSANIVSTVLFGINCKCWRQLQVVITSLAPEDYIFGACMWFDCQKPFGLDNLATC